MSSKTISFKERLKRDYTTLLAEGKTEELLSPKQGQSLYDIWKPVVDGRKARGRRYDLAGVLMVLVLAKLAGMSSVLAVSQWARLSRRGAAERLRPPLEPHAVCEYL